MIDPEPVGFGFLHERELFAGYRIRVVEATFRAPDGSEFTRDVVRDLGFVGVVPLLDTPDGPAVRLVRQYRGPVDRELWEIPAGLRDVPGEEPEVTARRELVEEVGLRADSLELLTVLQVAAGISDETGWIYLAAGADEVAHDRQGPEEHWMVVADIPLTEALDAVRSGGITDAKTVVALLMTADRLAGGGAPGPR